MGQIVEVPKVEIVDEVIEIPRVEYQEAAGETTYLPVDLGTVRRQEPTITEQVREVGPDLEAQVVQIADVQQQVVQQAPMVSMIQPMQSVVAPMQSVVMPTMGSSIM